MHKNEGKMCYLTFNFRFEDHFQDIVDDFLFKNA